MLHSVFKKVRAGSEPTPTEKAVLTNLISGIIFIFEITCSVLYGLKIRNPRLRRINLINVGWLKSGNQSKR
jgi:hypothetical protein